MKLKNKKILIGITGTIAAYKIPELIRMFKKEGADVKIVLTKNALEFVGVKTLETLSQNPVYFEEFETTFSTEHISLAAWADIFLVTPVSANTLSKFACGICDNLLTSVFCAFLGSKKPVVIAPSMNDGMWANPFVEENLAKLKFASCTIIEPEDGFLACGTQGKGRLAALDTIFIKTKEVLFSNLPFSGKKFLVTAGGTKEFIDPVRYISNASSGKMGTAFADVAHNLGADVELIATFDIERDYKITRAQTAQDMRNAVNSSFETADCIIMASAVADFKAKDYAEQKITSVEDTLILEFIKNKDILKEICTRKRENQIVVGFCLATENPVKFAKEKIQNKNCDYIIANEAKTALGQDKNEVWVIDKNLNTTKIELDYKNNIAKKVLELIYDKNR